MLVRMSRERTFGVTVTEVALKASSSVNERHIGTHVRLASVTADRTQLSKINHRQRFLSTSTHGDDNNMRSNMLPEF